MIAEKNDTIVKQEKQIKTMQDNESARIISTVKKLTGGIIDKYTAVVYLEATNQGKTGMQLVADTIYNRTNEPKFKETTISGVLKYPMQFNALTKLSTITDQTKQSQQYKQAYDIVISKLLYGTAISNDTLYFMNPSISNRGAANWMFRKQIVITYKDHVFFK
jgi:spore germination cell wall hydrolase CwlJ-like protein